MTNQQRNAVAYECASLCNAAGLLGMRILRTGITLKEISEAHADVAQVAKDLRKVVTSLLPQESKP